MKKRSFLVLATILMIVMAAVALFTANVSAAYEEYGLYIGGKQVTSNNLSGKGWRFEPDTNTLVLNGFEITSGGHFHKKINDGTTWLYSFIYVDNAKQMDLTIRTEARKAPSATVRWRAIPKCAHPPVTVHMSPISESTIKAAM